MSKLGGLFAFLVGGVVGAFVTLAVLERSDGGDVADPGAQVTPVASSAGAPARGSPWLDPTSDDATLAQALEEARFDQHWARVGVVARVLREREARPVAAPAPGEPAASPGEAPPSLVALDHGYRRRAFLEEQATHDNEATRLARAGLPPDELQAGLTELFLGPRRPGRPDDAAELIRLDAAHLLAGLDRPGARRVLLEALEGSDPDRADLAAEALGRADHPAATEALLAVLRGELDPAVRIRAAQALALTTEVVQGGPATATLARVARTDRDPAVRSHAIAALARADLAAAPAALDALLDVARDESDRPDLRLACVAALRAHRALAQTFPPGVLEALEQLLPLTRGAPAVRLEVIAALGEAGRRETLALLETALLAAADPAERQALTGAITDLRRRITLP